MDIPKTPDQWAGLTDTELFQAATESGMVQTSDQARFEANRRLIVALIDFKKSSDRAGRRLFWLTVAIVVLTAALVVLDVIRPLAD